ncbi:hypothetical protein DSECCO2_226080 [anaerobic digester metagenome]
MPELIVHGPEIIYIHQQHGGKLVFSHLAQIEINALLCRRLVVKSGEAVSLGLIHQALDGPLLHLDIRNHTDHPIGLSVAAQLHRHSRPLPAVLSLGGENAELRLLAQSTAANGPDCPLDAFEVHGINVGSHLQRLCEITQRLISKLQLPVAGNPEAI